MTSPVQVYMRAEDRLQMRLYLLREKINLSLIDGEKDIHINSAYP